MTMLFGVELFVDEQKVARPGELGTHGEGRERGGSPHTGSYGERRRENKPPAADSSATAAAWSVSIKNRQSCFLRRPASFNATVANALRQCGDMKPAICCCWGVSHHVLKYNRAVISPLEVPLSATQHTSWLAKRHHVLLLTCIDVKAMGVFVQGAGLRSRSTLQCQLVAKTTRPTSYVNR